VAVDEGAESSGGGLAVASTGDEDEGDEVVGNGIVIGSKDKSKRGSIGVVERCLRV
jgi:hypothetical protein